MYTKTLSVIFIHFLLLPSAPLFAQIGDCQPSQSLAILQAGNLQAKIYNNGALFWNGGQNLYEVPKGGGVNAIFASSFMIAGLVDNQLRAAASDYGPYEFWPGPLDAEGRPPEDCSQYDRIWEIRTEDFVLLETQDVTSPNMRNWPWELGAPVIDGDGNPNNYNLEGGDRPELLGDQTLWWIMNDRGNVHNRFELQPLGVEVHVSAYAFNQSGPGGEISFYRYRIINKNTMPLTEAYVAMWADTDLGNVNDDYIGSDSLLNLGYTYNADPIDENGYEDKPPALGYTFLLTPDATQDERDNDRDGEVDEPGESTGMYAAMTYNGGGGLQGDPADGNDLYNFMRGLWKDGSPITEGGTGLGVTDIPTRYMYSGDPVTRSYWSEFKPRLNDQPPLPPSDRRFIISGGPFVLPPGESTDVLVAIAATQGRNHLQSVSKLKGIVTNLQRSPQSFLVSGYDAGENETQVPVQNVLGFDQNFPNPFTSTTTIRYSIPQQMQVRLTVFDMLGREVNVLTEGIQEAGIYSLDFDGSNLPAGIYYTRFEADHLSFTKKMVRVP